MCRLHPSGFGALLLVVAFSCPFASPSSGQTLSDTVESMFKSFTDFELDRDTGDPALDAHREHFLVANNVAGRIVVDAFKTMLGSSLGSIPLASTISGVTFDFASGAPVAQTGSLGPIFAERATTLGSGKMNMALAYSYQKFTRFRGVPTEQVLFGFAHADVPGSVAGPDSSLGDNDNEFDTLALQLDMNVQSHQFVISGTYGVTDEFDVGVALPLITTRIEAVGTATFDSFTTIVLDGLPNHYYGEVNNRLLSSTKTFSNTKSGVGDLAIRAKYNFFRGQQRDAAVFADIRVPTGDEENFLGTGEANVRALLILSQPMGDFYPHLNTGFEYRGGDNDPNQFEISAGFDIKATDKATFALDFIGEYVAENRGENIVFPDAVVIEGPAGKGPGQNGEPREPRFSEPFRKVVDPTNIPNRTDDRSSLSVGFRWAAAEDFQIFANMLTKLDDGGIRASVVPTLGLQKTF